VLKQINALFGADKVYKDKRIKIIEKTRKIKNK